MLRSIGVAAAAVVASFAMAAPASAHVIKVTNPHTGETVREGWVGGDGAAHVHGLIKACGAEQSDVLRIYTFWNPLNSCTHFGP